jgi:molybdate transport system substrate-binding protein
MNHRKRIFLLLFAGLIATLGPRASASEVSIAAAADLKFAMDEIRGAFAREEPEVVVKLTYGSSGNFRTQIAQGAPFDVYFSADKIYPQKLVDEGHAVGPITPYAIGRIVLWSPTSDVGSLSLAGLVDPSFARIAIANPRHAPYGQRAEEALRAAGVWDTILPRLVYGENIAQTAQFVDTGNADVGIIALSLALSPSLSQRGGYMLVPDTLHAPLEQAWVVTRRGAGRPEVARFVQHFSGAEARAVLDRYGFVLPAGAKSDAE